MIKKLKVKQTDNISSMKTYWRSVDELANPQELRRQEVREEAKQKKHVC